MPDALSSLHHAGYTGRMKQHSITASDGTTLSFGLAGPEDGVPVLLCHGLGAGGAQFAADADWFAARGYRVLVPDLRGHGGSGMPPVIAHEAFAPEMLRADLYDMLDHAGMVEVHWVGNSLGGILGLGAAAERPERLASLALFGTALALNLPAAGWPFIALDYFPGRPLTAGLTAHNTTRNAAARPVIAAMLRRYQARAAAHIVDHIHYYDLQAAATGWRKPGLVLPGGRDHAVNRALLRQLDQLKSLPNWTIVDLPEGGHCANLDATEAWRAALVNFWSATAG
jgi:3-oxoadipate enol-lactonase